MTEGLSRPYAECLAGLPAACDTRPPSSRQALLYVNREPTINQGLMWVSRVA